MSDCWWCISDGKPEDYDDYKGQYAIEDTRKALLEAQGCGVHSFCITIDKSAHDYLAHMFGRGKLYFCRRVLSLPAKMAEMYRLLTSMSQQAKDVAVGRHLIIFPTINNHSTNEDCLRQ